MYYLNNNKNVLVKKFLLTRLYGVRLKDNASVGLSTEDRGGHGLFLFSCWLSQDHELFS